MKKNMLLALLTLVVAPATFEVAAYGSANQENKARQEEVNKPSSCGCKARVKTCPAKKTCPKKVKVCKKACPFVSKCLSCEERAAKEAREKQNREDMNEEERSMFELPKFRTE